MAKCISSGSAKSKTLAEITEQNTSANESRSHQNSGTRAAHNKRGQIRIPKTKPRRQPACRVQTEKTRSCKNHSKEKPVALEDLLVEQGNIKTPVETTRTRRVLSPSSESLAQNGSWAQHVAQKYSEKRNSKGRSKNHEKTKNNTKQPKSTVSMRRHHHATFSHLIHDACLRLKCNPYYNYRGFTRRAITKNIEKHYKVKLGKKFKIRFNLSFDRLVEKGKLIAHGKRRWGFRYTLSPSFLKQFERLKVIDGAARSPHGVKIRRSRSRSRSRSMSPSSSPRHGKGKRREKSHPEDDAANPDYAHYVPSHKRKREGSTIEPTKEGGGLTSWLWPNIKSQDGYQAETSYLEPYGERQRKIGKSNEGTNCVPDGIRKFKPIQVSYPSPDARSSDGSSSPESSPLKQQRWNEADSASLEPSSTSQSSSEPVEDIDNYYDVNNYFDRDIDDEADSLHSYDVKKPLSRSGSRQRVEHDLLHSIKSSSERRNTRQKSWMERIGDTLRKPFGGERTSTSSRGNQTNLPRSRSPSKYRPESSRRRLKKVMSRRKDVSFRDRERLSREASPSPRDSGVFCSPELANLLQE